MAAPSVSGQTVLLALNATGDGSAAVVGGSGTVTRALSAMPGQYNESQSSGFQFTGSSTTPNYAYLRFTLAGSTNLNTALVLLGIKFQATTDYARLDTKANNGQTILFYSNAALTEFAEYTLNGRDGDFIDPNYKGWTNCLIQPGYTSQALNVTASFNASTIFAVEIRIRKNVTTSLTSFYHRLISSTGFVLSLGDSGSKATLDNLLAYAATNLNYGFRRPALGQYISLLPINLGDGISPGLFEQSDVSLVFVSGRSVTDNPRNFIIPSNSLGLTIKTLEVSSLTRFSISSRTKWFFIVEAGANLNWIGGTLSGIGNSSIASGSFSGITISDSDRIDGGGATWDNNLITLTTSSSGAFHLKTGTILGRGNRFELNIFAPAIYINQSATYNLSEQSFNSNNVNITIDGVTATLILSAAQFTAYNSNPANFPITTINGGSVTVTGPVSQIVLSNIPQVTGAIVGVINLTTMAQTFPTISAGVASIPTDPATNYLIAVDAPGWVRQQVILSGATPAFALDWTNRDFRALYDQGDPLYQGIALNYSTFAVTVDQSSLQIGPATAFRRIEDLLATPQAIFFANPPFPLAVELSELVAEYYLVFPYDQENGVVNPVVIRPHPSNTLDVSLVGFSILLKGALDPFYDIFDFTQQPNGRIIRINTKSTFVQNVVSGGLSNADRAVIEEIALRTVDLPALIEDSGGKRFKAKALEQAPAPTGAGTGLGPEDIARLERIEQQLVADVSKGADRYQRLLPGTTTVILDKDVSYDPQTGFTLTEHQEPPP